MFFFTSLERTASFRITEGLLKTLDVDLKTLVTWANNNLISQEILFQPLTTLMGELCGRETSDFPNTGLWVLSNPDRILGASMLLRDDALEKVGTCFECDAIILPSSIHEVLAFPFSDDVDLLGLVDMVKSINAECVEQEERLSDNVYIYHQQDRYLTAVL